VISPQQAAAMGIEKYIALGIAGVSVNWQTADTDAGNQHRFAD